ncbi:MAG: DMT family transporter [Aestuariivita sp.]|nr:DMT family transporter [Aestuariivita sp.]MCY4201786.1 DMT family transporter [Aestuariivita sp.]MCY4288466.1 DMT family transporter [Aestuariivita sp.]MCY4347051.1 DMT family transporter [Aestuariivita sp.]
MPLTISLRSWGEIFILGLIWGASFFSIRVALWEVPFLTSVLHRTGWAMLVLWALVIALRLRVPREPRIWFAFLIMGILNNVIPFSLMAWAQIHVETGVISILNSVTALFAVLVAALFFVDERLTLSRLIGVTLGVTGCATVIGLENLDGLDIYSIAQLAVLIGTLSYAFAAAWARLHLTTLSPIMAATGMLTMATLLLLPVAQIFDGPMEFNLMPITWLAIAYYSLIATAGAYLLYFHIIATSGSGNTMLVTLIIPPVAIFLGAAFLDESLDWTAFVGFFFIALGLFILDGNWFNKINPNGSS